MEVNVAPVPGHMARKRRRNPQQWKRNVQKRSRYSASSLPDLSNRCSHKDKKMNCSELTPQDLRKFREAFYSKPDKNYQDNFILKYMKVKVPSRRRPRVGARCLTMTHTKLYIRKRTPLKLVHVCQKCFRNVLGISEHRIRTIAKQFLYTGKPPQEKRGGDRVSHKNVAKKRAVMGFIESFKCIESHYCRSATSQRKYVPSDLNIRKMWRMYNNQQTNNDLKVRQCYFRNIFNCNYNIGFNTPRVDVCSKCLSYTERIKHEKIPTIKATLMGELRLHKLKAKCFHRMLKEYKDEILTLSFDCQKNQVLPKVPDQSAYYSRQLYMYNFAVVKGNVTQNIAKENVFLYAWTENVHRKSSNEIASALYHCIMNINFENIKTLRLMGDGCGSQNKNSTVIAMCAYWLVTQAPTFLKKIEIIFPVPGHSFLPADRIFGLIEKEIKNIEQIIEPEQYLQIYNNYGTVNKLGTDCPVFDWKVDANDRLKRPGQYHFQFLPTKRFYLKRVKNNPQRFLIKGEVNYQNNLGVYKSIIKKNKNIFDMSPALIEPGKIKISELKIADVTNLLKNHYGSNWEEQFGVGVLIFYKEIIHSSEFIDNDENEETAEAEIYDLCNYYPEEVSMSV